MKCPFKTIRKNLDSAGRLCCRGEESVQTAIEFGECDGKQCAAWNEYTTGAPCELCKKYKGVE